MTPKTIRIWYGCKVVAVFTVTEGGTTFLGAVGGAANSSRADIELDPWTGLVVDHGQGGPPVSIHEQDGTVDELRARLLEVADRWEVATTNESRIYADLLREELES